MVIHTTQISSPDKQATLKTLRDQSFQQSLVLLNWSLYVQPPYNNHVSHSDLFKRVACGISKLYVALELT